MINPDAFRPLPEKQVISPWYGMARSLNLVALPFDAADSLIRLGTRLASWLRMGMTGNR